MMSIVSTAVRTTKFSKSAGHVYCIPVVTTGAVKCLPQARNSLAAQDLWEQPLQLKSYKELKRTSAEKATPPVTLHNCGQQTHKLMAVLIEQSKHACRAQAHCCIKKSSTLLTCKMRARRSCMEVASVAAAAWGSLVPFTSVLPIPIPFFSAAMRDFRLDTLPSLPDCPTPHSQSVILGHVLGTLTSKLCLGKTDISPCGV